MFFTRTQTVIAAVSAASLAAPIAVGADVQWFNQNMADEWWASVGEVTTIDFTGYSSGTPLSTQYAHLGVRFDNDEPLFFFESGIFINDNRGFLGEEGAWIDFDEPQNWIAADFPGALGYELYSGDELIYTSFEMGAGGTGQFGGLVSSKPFDRVFLWREPDGPFGQFSVFVDDLHFGALPAPGAIGVFALALFTPRRRRTR